MEDLYSLSGTCQTMRTACMECVVRSPVALEREGSMKWLVFTQGRTDPVGTACLRQVAAADHKVAAYMLGVLLYGDNEAEQYIRKVEGEDVAHGCKPEASRTNRECVRCCE
ncbi:unnamed protein product [Miscanthus lutarioriparius]|uniref:Uncharacterized protein n=1 Tax=Miscanthus lutarioriparius TaxID=422564 RepID=A0A811QJ74_9POAL|nr:unnamed protein product [Miscanthus lutarioriparius]